jgi:hypothetical protein
MSLQQPEWEKMCEDYWKWFYSKPRTAHPALDNNGKLVSTGQNNPNLFFLTGAVDRNRKDIVKKHTIEAQGKKIFMPVHFCVFVDSDLPKGTNLVEAANKDIDGTRSIEFDTSDNIIVEDVRRVKVPELFEVDIANPPFFENTKPGKQMASSDGYWLLTKPLETGELETEDHIISISGETKEDNEFYGGVTYHLKVI